MKSAFKFLFFNQGLIMKIWQCAMCGYLYDEEKGDAEHGIAPGMPWDEVPEDWSCPDCGIGKSDFSMIEL